MSLTRRLMKNELAFLLDSTVDLPQSSYDRDVLLMRLESAVLTMIAEARAEALADALREMPEAVSPLSAQDKLKLRETAEKALGDGSWFQAEDLERIFRDNDYSVTAEADAAFIEETTPSRVIGLLGALTEAERERDEARAQIAEFENGVTVLREVGERCRSLMIRPAHVFHCQSYKNNLTGPCTCGVEATSHDWDVALGKVGAARPAVGPDFNLENAPSTE